MYSLVKRNAQITITSHALHVHKLLGIWRVRRPKAPDYGDVNAVVNDRNPLWFFVFLEPEFKDDNHTISKFGSSLPSWLEKLQLSHV